MDDPKIIAVPFITLRALWESLANEATAESRQPIQRRMLKRLDAGATQVMAAGGGQFSGRMYKVRSKTRKRVEACWADAMDMCGIARHFWPEDFVTGASALSCDGKIRPASAVTNIHSLWGFARAMGLRHTVTEGETMSMTNGGATISLRCTTNVERPTRSAHFSGSPNGRYRIIEEMSQHTAESLYAEAVWSSGCVPQSDRLEPGHAVPSPAGKTARSGKSDQTSDTRVEWPSQITPPTLDQSVSMANNLATLASWVSMINSVPRSNHVSYLELIDKGNPAVITCIRSYPRSRLSTEQREACHTALFWCLRHWWMDEYQRRHWTPGVDVPRIPLPNIEWIGAEFVTGAAQAREWCAKADENDAETVLVPEKHWRACKDYTIRKLSTATDVEADPDPLSEGGRRVLEKVLQTWKLHTFCLKFRTGHVLSKIEDDDRRVSIVERDAARAILLLLSMALVGTATDSAVLGSSEETKFLEVELG